MCGNDNYNCLLLMCDSVLCRRHRNISPDKVFAKGNLFLVSRNPERVNPGELRKTFVQ